MANKVENKRNANITKAVKAGDWSSVDKLLSQPFENLKRKDKDYSLSSLNAEVQTEENIQKLWIYMLTIPSIPLKNC